MSLIFLTIQFFYEKTRRLSRDISFSPHDPDLLPTQMKPSNDTSTHDVEQLCKCILKSIQNCMSYGPDKNLTFKCDLDLGPT